jgi:tRNA-uridine 2-sulfurtransferase
VLGRHDGVLGFTIGQRRGLGVASGEPLYVVRLDAPSRRVVVGPREALAVRRVRLSELNWLGDVPLDELPDAGVEVAARVRSTRAPRPGLLRIVGGAPTVELLGPEEGVAPGQACVLYDGAGADARVLGGGTIMRDVEARVAA